MNHAKPVFMALMTALLATAALACGSNSVYGPCDHKNAGDACTTDGNRTGVCFQDRTGVKLTCFQGCTGAMDSATCGIGAACYYYAAKYVCMGIYYGQKTSGECGFPNDCAGMYQCIGIPGGVDECFRACKDTATDCSVAGATCKDAWLGFSTCQALY